MTKTRDFTDLCELTEPLARRVRALSKAMALRDLLVAKNKELVSAAKQWLSARGIRPKTAELMVDVRRSDERYVRTLIESIAELKRLLKDPLARHQDFHAVAVAMRVANKMLTRGGGLRAGQFGTLIAERRRILYRGVNEAPFGKNEQAWKLYLYLNDNDDGCDRDILIDEVWDGYSPDSNTVDKLFVQARQLLEPIKLTVKSVRKKVRLLAV